MHPARIITTGESRLRMARLLFVRHGETEHNILGQISTLPPGGALSPRGVAQVRTLSQRLSHIRVSAVYSSPLLRAQQTAELIAEAHGLPIVVRDELRELSAGNLDGRGDEEAFAILNGALDAWCLGDDEVRIGETGDFGRAVIDRLRSFVSAICESHASQTVVLVSHGGLLQTGIPWVCENLTPRYGYRNLVPNGAIIEVECDDLGTHCVSWNAKPLSTAHLAIVS